MGRTIEKVGTRVRIKAGRAFGTAGKTMKIVAEMHPLYHLAVDGSESYVAADRSDFVKISARKKA